MWNSEFNEAKHLRKDNNWWIFFFFWMDWILIACFSLLSHRGQIVLGYTEAELCMRGSGYQFIHAADMLYCAESHVRSKSGLPVSTCQGIPQRCAGRLLGWTSCSGRAVPVDPSSILCASSPLLNAVGELLQKRPRCSTVWLGTSLIMPCSLSNLC